MRDKSGHRLWDATSPQPRVLIECPASASPSIVAGSTGSVAAAT